MSEISKTSAPDKDAGASEKKSDGFVEFIKTVVFAVILAVGIRTVAYEPFNIPSESMLPTLMVGDYLFVSKFSYGYSRHSLPGSLKLFSGRILANDVKRGDVIVFKLPRDGRTDYIKRVIGLPGDRIQLRNSVVYINDVPVKRERVEDFTFEETPNATCRDRPEYRKIGSGAIVTCHYPQYRETLPDGVNYMTLDLVPGHSFDNTRVYTIPDGHYFAMGDNRDNSLDSRRPMSEGVGYIPFENLVGRAEMLFFSTDGNAKFWQPWKWFQAMRYNRFFDSLRPNEPDEE